MADAGDAQLVELVELADAGERDAVVDLGELAQVFEGFSAHSRTPSAKVRTTALRPRAMPLRAKSALSFIACSGAT